MRKGHLVRKLVVATRALLLVFNSIVFAVTRNGGSGPDALIGTGRNDTLLGLAGSDRLDGGPGNDRLNGGSGNDGISGGTGTDYITGGPGRDNIRGFSGKDRIFVRDGQRDTVDCGSGVDRVTADRIDRIRKNCEEVKRPRKKRR